VLDLIDELRALTSALDRRGVPFAVCGGLAVAVHVRARATVDVDLLVPGDALEDAQAVARSLGYRIEAGPMRVANGAGEIFHLTRPDPETGDLLSLDLLRVTPALESVWTSRERVEWEHGTLPVVSRAGLAAMKRLRGSGVNADDIRALEEE
jgi:hypothetical protein